MQKTLAIVAATLLCAPAAPATAAGPALALLAPWWLGRHVIGTVARLATLPLLAAAVQAPEYPADDRYGYEAGPRGYYSPPRYYSPPPYYSAPRTPYYAAAPAHYARPYYAPSPPMYYPRVAGYYPAPYTYYRPAPYYVRPQPRVYEPPRTYYPQHAPYSYSAHIPNQTRGFGYRRR